MINIKILQPAWRLGLWLTLSLAFFVTFFRGLYPYFLSMLSPKYVFEQGNILPWGVLALCLTWLYFKRQIIWSGMRQGTKPAFIFLGIILVTASALMPISQSYIAFQMPLASLGFFTILFGRAAKLPLILLAIYSLAIFFPLIISIFKEDLYSKTTIVPLMALLPTLGYPLQNQGQWLNITTQSGNQIQALVTAACAGTESMGIFISLFALMMLDAPLPAKRAAWLFAFGVLGTWFQNLLRVSFLIVGSYYLGAIPWTAHRYVIYFIFPLWYFFFAYIYFKQVKGLPKRITNPTQ